MSEVVIVGAGLGGFRVARSLRDAGFTGAVTVVGDETHLPYDRPPLSKQLLAGTFAPEQCRLAGETGDIEWVLGRAALGADLEERRLILEDGSVLGFDHLVVATGRRARPWPCPTPAGVHTLRSLGDVAAFDADLVDATSVVIIGAGFVGCEAAATLRGRGLDVTVIDTQELPMPVIGRAAGAAAKRLHEEHGVRWRLGEGVAGFEGAPHVSAVRLASGELLRADAVLVSIGSLPNTEWLEGTRAASIAGVLPVTGEGEVIGEDGAAIPGLWAVGDVAAWAHPHSPGPVCIEHWSNARDMAAAVATNILAEMEGRPHERKALSSVPSFWSDQYDVKFKSVGLLRAADELVVVEEAPERHGLLVEARAGGRVVGAITLNMPRAILTYQRELRALPA
ncbi:MAG: FAD-dependent oxidoreductase [Acidimicrobiaceae bacterium]|nr:FAD-dependent oxidoreductase [Acidimicrobiaceae bacterium]